MKKLYTLAALFMLSVTSAFAQADLAIIHSVQTGDTITVDATNPPAEIFGYSFVNYGPNALTQTDTLFLRTMYTQGYFVLTLPVAGLPVNDTVYFYDTVAFTGGTQPTGNLNWCDSIWAKNSSNAVIVDPTPSNNKMCHVVYLNNISLSVGEQFTTSKSGASLNVYPNPASTSINFDYYANSFADASVLVTDVTGRKVHQQKLGNVQGAQKATIDASNFSNGLYIVELRVGNTKQVGKFSVQK